MASSSEIRALNRRLLEQRQELEAALEGNRESSEPVTLDQQSVGRVSRIDAIQQQQMALANRQQAAARLRQVEQALQRIDAGDYGDCLECGEPIAVARLEAQPWCRLCIDCQSAQETN